MIAVTSRFCRSETTSVSSGAQRLGALGRYSGHRGTHPPPSSPPPPRASVDHDLHPKHRRDGVHQLCEIRFPRERDVEHREHNLCLSQPFRYSKSIVETRDCVANVEGELGGHLQLLDCTMESVFAHRSNGFSRRHPLADRPSDLGHTVHGGQQRPVPQVDREAIHGTH
eukprot:2179888-Rhodomonas_salina.1